ncbi:SDR family oxidoreductase [Pseudomonas sp. DG56-2]|uniref:UDP-glucose 4-epimerase family protein n=1 Tax=Pseudomonas sp. DG56-2 TaxID=2320270 RepID=UPI0010A5BAA4|nr:SDR family oxidoreductase [Pseudomonas sp. DG56-2]
MKQRRVLVTGATGFVGSSVVDNFSRDSSLQVLAGVRNVKANFPENVEPFLLGSLEAGTTLGSLEGIEAIVHCAARVHVMNDQAADPLSEFRKVNVEGTLNLARRAAAAGVQRFIFISSIKVNGEGTDNRLPYTADEMPSPVDPYGISKLEAEQSLRALASESGMAVTIIRPVLVYGPGVKANFYSMMKWLQNGLPLPLANVHNKRSMVALENLVDLIKTCLDHPAAINQIFLVSDDEDLSTPELLRLTARALGGKAFLVPFPVIALTFIARLFGRPAIAARLCGTLQVDISKTRSMLEWTPPVSVDQALNTTARQYLESRRT